MSLEAPQPGELSIDSTKQKQAVPSLDNVAKAKRSTIAKKDGAGRKAPSKTKPATKKPAPTVKAPATTKAKA